MPTLVRDTNPAGDVFQADRSTHHPRVRAVLPSWLSTDRRMPNTRQAPPFLTSEL